MTIQELYELRLKGNIKESIDLYNAFGLSEIGMPLLMEYFLSGYTDKIELLAKHFKDNQNDICARELFLLDYKINNNEQSLSEYNKLKPTLNDKAKDYIKIPKYKIKKQDKANAILAKALASNDNKKCEKLLLKASKYELTDAEYNLGSFYKGSNWYLSNQYFKKAAKKNHYESIVYLANYNKKEPKNELFWLKKLAELNNPEGLYRMSKNILEFYDKCLNKADTEYDYKTYNENLDIVSKALEKAIDINNDVRLMLANLYDESKHFDEDLFKIYLYYLPYKDDKDILERINEIKDKLIKKVEKKIDRFYINREFKKKLNTDEITKYSKLFRKAVSSNSHKLKEELAKNGHISMLRYMISYYENKDKELYLYWMIKALDNGVAISKLTLDSKVSEYNGLDYLFKLKQENSPTAISVLEGKLESIDDSMIDEVINAANNKYIDAVEFLVSYYENKDLSETLIWMVKAYDLGNKKMLLKIAEAYVELLKPIDDIIIKMIVDNPNIKNKYIEYFLGFMARKKEICDKYNINATLRDSLNHYIAASTIQKYKIRKEIYLRIAKCYLEGIGTNIDLELAAQYYKPYDKELSEELIKKAKEKKEIRAIEWQVELEARKANKINQIIEKFNLENKQKAKAIEKSNSLLKKDTYSQQIEKRDKLLLKGYPMDMLYDENGKFIGSQFIYGAYQMIMDVDDAKNMLRAKREYETSKNNGNVLQDLNKLKEQNKIDKLKEKKLEKDNQHKITQNSNSSISSVEDSLNNINSDWERDSDPRIDYFNRITRKDRKINLFLIPMISDDTFPNKYRIINRYTYSSNVGQYVIKEIYINNHLMNIFDEITALSFCLKPGVYDFKVVFKFVCLPSMNKEDDFRNTVYKNRENLDITHTFECRGIEIKDDDTKHKLVLSACFYSIWDKTEYEFKNNRDFYVLDFKGWKYHINDMRIMSEAEINQICDDVSHWDIYRARRFNPKITSFEKILARAEEEIYLIKDEDL